jgi:hypothetical protein
MRYLTPLLTAAVLSFTGAASAADPAKPANPGTSGTTAPVAQPPTDPAVSNSGEMVPGQPIRPEGTEEASVPKTPKDKRAANTADVGAAKANTKASRPSAGSGTAPPPPAPPP